MGNMYSLKTKGIYPSDKNGQQAYIDAGSLPDDLQPISDEDYNNYINPPDGYYSVFDDKGPRIEKLPPPDYVAIAEKKKQIILDGIASNITVYQTKLLIGRTLTDEEKSDLNAWLDYSDKVNAIDTSTAPNITWPTSPDDESTT